MRKVELPRVEDLTNQQQNILKVIESIAIYGGAGTGKTLVSIWRHILNYREKRGKSYLITFTHTLTYFLQEFAKFEPDSQTLGFDKNIDNKHRFIDSLETEDFSDFDEVIIDEAQDIELETFEKLKETFEKISYGADDYQMLYPNSSTTKNELETIFPENSRFTLSENFRNSYEILKFTDSVFPNRISQKILNYAEENSKTGIKPQLIVSEKELEREESLIRLINKKIPAIETIGILVPTQNYTSASIDNLKRILDKGDIDYSFYDNRENPKSSKLPEIRRSGIKRIHLTTFKSSKGLEFDAVIIPNFEEMEFWSKKGNIITKNDYYVGFTRAKNELYLISENSILDKTDLYEIH